VQGEDKIADFKPSYVEGFVDVSSIPASLAAYGTQTLVGANTETTIVTLTANGIRNMTHVSCSGDAYAEWRLYINSVLVETRRTGPSYNVEFVWRNPMSLITGTVIDIKVVHHYVSETATFNSAIYGF